MSLSPSQDILLTKLSNFTSLRRLHCDFRGRPLETHLSATNYSFAQRLAGLLPPDRHLQTILSDRVYDYNGVVTYTLRNSYAKVGEVLGYRESADRESLRFNRVPTPAWRAPPVGC
jgi:hypothetical protein